MTINDNYKQIVSKLGYADERHFLTNIAIPALSKYWNEKSVFIVEAPTGYGKTCISLAVSLYSINEEMKAIVAYPQRCLLEDQFEVFTKIFSPNILGKRYLHNPGSLYLLKPVTLTTIDTLSLTMFGVPPEDLSKAAKHINSPIGSWGHYLFSVASVGLSNIILDEAHIMADSTKSLNFLIMLARFAIECGRKLVIMSATMSDAVKKIISTELRPWKEKMLFIQFTKDQQKLERQGLVEGGDSEFIEKRSLKNYDITCSQVFCHNKNEYIAKILLERKQESDDIKAIVIFNTVKDAVDFYGLIKNAGWALEIPKLLIHSRFTEENRRDKSRALDVLKTGKSYIIVATQVLEVGVNISSNVMISEIAPASSLIQRFGRFLRYDETQGKAFVWYEVDESGELLSSKFGSDRKYKVYDWYLTKATIRNLDSSLSIHIPFNYKERKGFSNLLNAVYGINSITSSQTEISELYGITGDLEHMSEKAIRFLKSNDGSFVRNDLTVPVIPKKTPSCSYSNYQKMVVPIPFSAFRRLSDNGLIEELVKWNEDGEDSNGAFNIVPFESKCFCSPFQYLKQSLTDSILGFVVAAEYNSEIGLVYEW